jgi:2-hydroxychromene-2-carboxylate isomerase
MRRFIERHGLTQFKRNPHFPVNTLKVMRGACAAQQLGCFEGYVEAVYAAMWEQGLNMSEDAVIQGVLEAAGIDATALLAAAQNAEVKARLLDNTQRSYDRGAFGSPSFFVGEELFFGKDRLRDVEEEIGRLQQGKDT